MYYSDKILVVDLEATCWENRTEYQRQHSEIIEIGICVLDTNTGEINKSKGILVKPFKSEVSIYCSQLTTLTQEMLDKDGVTLGEAIIILRDEYKSQELTWASYGDFDKKMLKNQTQKWNIPFPMSENHINVKKEFGKINGKAIGMARALEVLNIPLEGTHHRGVDDAKNIAKIVWRILNN